MKALSHLDTSSQVIEAQSEVGLVAEKSSTPIHEITSGFAPGVPVQPVFIRYKNELDTCTWSWEGPGALKQLWLTLTQFSIRCELEFLPVYRPSEYERENPRIFAENVRSFVSCWTETPMSCFTVDDARFLKMAKDNFLPPTAALVKLLRLRKSIG
ncbi:lysophosphatidylcholine acyltransferase 1 [Trichonephila clavipes]|nr:lysophosphatidylcholine acyltransferase 1 [Trichonephila clavipes]